MMRIETVICTVLVAILAILASPASVKSCEPYNPYRYTGAETLEVYKFPLLPGTPEWKDASRAFREGVGPNPRESFKVGDSLLSGYSTEDLLWTALRFPHRRPWGTYSVAYPSFAGLESNFFSRFNGAKIAKERNDFTVALLDLYRQQDPNALSNCPFDSELHRNYFQEDLGLLEILLSSDTVLSQLSLREKEDLLRLVLDRFPVRSGHVAGNGSSAALAGRILLSVDASAFRQECEGQQSLAVFLENPHVDITSHYPFAEQVMESGRRWLDKRGRADE